MIDLNKFEMAQKAARELFEAVQKNYYDLSDLNIINYSDNNRSKFESHGYIINSIAENSNQPGDAARYQSTIQWSSRGTEVIHGRWQEIRYSKRNNSPYITMFGKRLYLTNFMRNDYGRL